MRPAIIYNHNGILSNLTYEDYCRKIEERDIDKKEHKLNKTLTQKIGTEALIQCNVCFDKIHTYGLINCGHIYCFNCISNWANQTNRCPLCKQKFNVIKKIDGEKKDYIQVQDREKEEDD